MRKSNPVRLLENKRACQMFEATPRWDVILLDKPFFQCYFNMRGYVGYLPVPPREENENKVIALNFGEVGITTLKREVAQINREWKEFLSQNPDWQPTPDNLPGFCRDYWTRKGFKWEKSIAG